MTLEDFADFTRDALLIVRGGRISHANAAARVLFDECGFTEPLTGAMPEDLWQADPQVEPPDPARGLHVRTRAAVSCRLIVHATRHFGVGASRECALRIEPARQQRSDFLAAAANEAADAIMVVDPETLACVGANAAVEQVYGIPVDVAMERGVSWMWETLGLGTPDFDAGLVARHPAADTQDLSIRKDQGGETAFIEATRRAIQVDGKWLVMSVSRDVTQKRAERKRLLRLREAINQTSDGVAVIESTTWN
jgi:PAS domain-containing protein